MISLILIVSFYLIFLIISDFDSIIDTFQFFDKTTIPLILAISFSVITLKGIIQKKLLSHIGIQLSWKTSILLYYSGLSMIITPGGAGLLIKSYFLKHLKNVQVSKTIPLVIAERFYDLLADVILILFTLLFFQSVESIITAIIYLPIISIFLFTVKKESFFSNLQIFIKRIPIIKKRFNIEPELVKSLSIFFSFKIFIFMTSIILLITIYESIIFYLSFYAFDVQISFFKIIQIFYSSLLLGTISFIPAATGPLETIFANMLHNEEIDLAKSASLIIFIRLMTLWIPSGVGFFIAYLKFIRKN